MQITVVTRHVVAYDKGWVRHTYNGYLGCSIVYLIYEDGVYRNDCKPAHGYMYVPADLK